MEDYYKYAAPLIASFLPKVSTALAKQANAAKQILFFESTLKEYLARSAARHSVIPVIVDAERKKALYEIYIPLTLQSFTKKQSYKLDKLDSQILHNHRAILIEDAAGMGKSTILKWFFLETLSNSNMIPVFVDLRRLTLGTTLKSYIHTEICKYGDRFDEIALTYLLESGDFIVLLDGYDEIPQDVKAFATSQIADFSDVYQKNRIILTSRPDLALTSLVRFDAFKVQPLKKSEAFELLKKYSHPDTSKLIKLTNEINSNKNSTIYEFLGNPLLVSLLLVAFDHRSSLPLKRTSFYEQVYEALFDRHDISKGENFTRVKVSGLEKSDLEVILSKFAMRTIQLNGLVEYSQSEFREHLTKAVASSGLKTQLDKLCEDLLSSVPIFVRDGTLIRWAHKSFQDYFGAIWLRKYSDGKHIEFLKGKGNPFSDKFHSFSHMIDLFGELDPIKFHKYFSIPFLTRVNEHFDRFSLFMDKREPASSPRVRAILSAFDRTILISKIEVEKNGQRPYGKVINESTRLHGPPGVTSWSVINIEPYTILISHSKYSNQIQILSNHKVNIATKFNSNKKPTDIDSTEMGNIVASCDNICIYGAAHFTQEKYKLYSEIVQLERYTHADLDFAKIQENLKALKEDQVAEPEDDILM